MSKYKELIQRLMKVHDELISKGYVEEVTTIEEAIVEIECLDTELQKAKTEIKNRNERGE
jgi:hypothetical protein